MLLLDPPPVPILAEFSTGFGTVLITFSGPIVRLGFNAANWSIRASGSNRVPTMSSAPGFDKLSLMTVFGGPNPGPDVISYSAMFPLLEDTLGNPLSSFTDFPLTIIP